MSVIYLYIFIVFILIYVCELKLYSPYPLCSMANSLTKPFIYFIILVVVAIYQYGHWHIRFIIIIPILNLKSVFDVYPEEKKNVSRNRQKLSHNCIILNYMYCNPIDVRSQLIGISNAGRSTVLQIVNLDYNI